MRRAHVMVASATAALLAALPAAEAQTSRPRQVLGGILVFLMATETCGIAVPSEERRALMAAGGRLQEQLGLGREDFQALAAELARRPRQPDCLRTRAGARSAAASLLAEARALAPP